MINLNKFIVWTFMLLCCLKRSLAATEDYENFNNNLTQIQDDLWLEKPKVIEIKDTTATANEFSEAAIAEGKKENVIVLGNFRFL